MDKSKDSHSITNADFYLDNWWLVLLGLIFFLLFLLFIFYTILRWEQ